LYPYLSCCSLECRYLHEEELDEDHKEQHEHAKEKSKKEKKEKKEKKKHKHEKEGGYEVQQEMQYGGPPPEYQQQPAPYPVQ